MRAVRGRRLLAILLVTTAFAPAAHALPGDAPFAPISPADGAQVPVNAAGIPVEFSCPLYRIDDSGIIPIYGGPRDYGVTFATAPALGPDGRLAPANVVSTSPGSHVPGTPDDRCVGAMGAGGSQRPQETPGTYYWQVWRLCLACTGSYETGPVRTLIVRAQASLAVRAAGRAFAGFPVAVPLTLTGLPDRIEVRLERRAGSTWRRVATTIALREAGEAVATLPAGTQTLRVTALVGSETVVSAERTLVVRPVKGWKTGPVDAGRYAGTGSGNRSVKLRVAASGREIRAFSAFVAMTCPGVTPGTFTTQIGTASIARARLDPDGRFLAVVTPRGSTSIRIRGKVAGGRILAGRAELSVGNCTGSSAFTAKRAS